MSACQWQQLGMHSVPSVIIDEQHLIRGGLPGEDFAQAPFCLGVAQAGRAAPATSAGPRNVRLRSPPANTLVSASGTS
jgi:hypothetical protein